MPPDADIDTTVNGWKFKSNEAFQSLQTKIKCFNTEHCQVSTQGAYMTYISHFDQKYQVGKSGFSVCSFVLIMQLDLKNYKIFKVC